MRSTSAVPDYSSKTIVNRSGTTYKAIVRAHNKIPSRSNDLSCIVTCWRDDPTMVPSSVWLTGSINKTPRASRMPNLRAISSGNDRA